ncbi:hypothetical protein DEU56DRAFT_756357 [Suillus clintonianus]|uniref:uncharacterized protein n=1 Tax=Suillus clintonianus TaxID=1904413 RepID=UPI001B8611A7|nr:uncharacterized protein DEU56DRAFT_756357 [Suillus clintonianus]KAG2136454.1 hypothetical protein DEU56DRAFT_756357 [Suillus clintonianus]
MAIQASDYANGTDSGSSVKIRFLGVTSSASHTSETQVEGWTETISDISTVFNNSPLAHHSHEILDLAGFLHKLKGMNGDHASDVKKTRHLIEQWKHESIRISLGHEAIIEMSSEDLKPLLDDAESSKVAELGGHDSWISLSAEDHQQHWSQIMDMLALRLGTECFDQLPAEIQREHDLFFFGLNAVKGGNTAMMAVWDSKESSDRPVLLANKDNDATIRLSSLSDGSSAAVERALKLTKHGAAKLIEIAGNILNHKDDKKGLQDFHHLMMEELTDGACSSFPDTSNTRYQTYGAAACHIIKFWPQYIELLELARISKENETFNQPYGEESLCWPSLLENSLGIHELGALWGEPWEDPTTITACLDLYDSLTLEQQDLAKELLCAFFKGELKPMNDLHSSLRLVVWLQHQHKPKGMPLTCLPRMMLTKLMFNRNNTQAFMNAHFTTDDHKYTMLLAWKKEKIARKKKQKAVERASKKAHIEETLNATQIVFDWVVIEKMNVRTLDAQLDKLKALGVPDIKPKSRRGVWAVKLQSLMTALASYFNMLLQTPVEPVLPQNLEDTTDTHGDELIESYGEEDDMDFDDE